MPCVWPEWRAWEGRACRARGDNPPPTLAASPAPAPDRECEVCRHIVSRQRPALVADGRPVPPRVLSHPLPPARGSGRPGWPCAPGKAVLPFGQKAFPACTLECTGRDIPVMMVRDVRHDHAHVVHVQEQEQGQGQGQQEPWVSEPQVQAPSPRPQGFEPKPGPSRIIHHNMIAPFPSLRHPSPTQHAWPWAHRRSRTKGRGRLTAAHSPHASSHRSHRSHASENTGKFAKNACTRAVFVSEPQRFQSCAEARHLLGRHAIPLRGSRHLPILNCGT